MKKLILIMLFAVNSYFLHAQSKQILNGGFEDWSSKNLYENPTSWGSSNTNEYRGIVLVEKSGDAYHGNYSIKISNGTVNGDSLFGYVFKGTIGNDGPSGGIPFTDSCNTIKGYYKSNLQGNDTAYALVIKFMGGNMISMDMILITDSSTNSWTSFSLPFNPSKQDEIFFGFLASNPFDEVTPTPGSWLMVDSISIFHNQNPLPIAINNFSFETWENTAYNEPDYWYSFNAAFAGLGKANVKQSSIAFSGTYAVEIQSDSLNGNFVPGVLSIAPLHYDEGFNFIPYVGVPTELSGRYQYIPSGLDTGSLFLIFRKNGTTYANYNIPLVPTTGTYSSFSIPINLLVSPDSMALVFFAGNNGGSKLLIDDVTFSGGNVNVKTFAYNFLQLFPNPTQSNCNVSFYNNKKQNITYSLFDMQGKLVYTETAMQAEGIVNQTLFLNSLAKGAYFLSVISEDTRLNKKIIIE